MGSATKAFFDRQPAVLQVQRAGEERRRRINETINHVKQLKDEEVRRQLAIKIPQLIELVSARNAWTQRRRLRGYVFELSLYERWEGYDPLCLNIWKTMFGRVKYSVGFVRRRAFSSKRFIAPYTWDENLLEHVNSHIEKLKLQR